MRFRMFIVLTLMTAGAISMAAQIPGPPPKDVFFSRVVTSAAIDSSQATDELISKVRATLNLSDAQIVALQTLLTMRKEASAKIAQTAMESQKKLEELLKQSNPNPTEVGSAFLATRAVQDELQAIQEKFRLDFRAMLSADQRAVLDRLQTAADQTASLSALGIIAPPIGGAPLFVEGPLPGSGTGFAIGIQRRLSKDR